MQVLLNNADKVVTLATGSWNT